jgi:hypothetical protein
MKLKMGRPTMPKGTAKAVLFAVKMAANDADEIDRAVEQTGQDKPEWMRNALLAEAKNPPVFFKSKWKLEELDGKTVEFKLTAPTYWVEGLGKFQVLENNRGEIKIDIIVKKHETPFKITENRYHLYKQTADKIRIHPNQKSANFRLSA